MGARGVALARSRQPSARTPLGVIALALAVSLLATLFGASGSLVSMVGKLAALVAGAAAMFGFASGALRRGAGGAPLAREVAQARALLKAGDAAAALELLRGRLAAADDAEAARALSAALRGRGDAPEALAQALLTEIRAGHRAAASALWGELTVHGAPVPRESAELHKLAGWLRGAGALGEARGVALAALDGADAATVARLAKEARRGDPVFAQRAAERALAAPGLNALERKALEELLAGARREARNAGVVVLDANTEAAAQRSKRTARSRARLGPARRAFPEAEPTAPLETSDWSGTEAALDPNGAELEIERGLDLPEVEAEPTADPVSVDDAHEAFFERGAIDLAPEDPAPPELPDPEVAGDDAFVDALHQALTSEGGLSAEIGEEASPHPPAPEADAAVTTFALGEEPPAEAPRADSLGGRRVEAERRAPSARGVEPARGPTGLRAGAAPSPPSAHDFAFGTSAGEPSEASDPKPPPLRPLQVRAASPRRLASDALVVELEGRGKAKLAYDKIDAVAAAGVKGLSASGKAVLLIDLAIGYAKSDGPLRVVRLRADRFDPRDLVPGHSSPLAALRALVSELRARTRGVALPREASPNAPFRIFTDEASYERDTFGGSGDLGSKCDARSGEVVASSAAAVGPGPLRRMPRRDPG